MRGRSGNPQTAKTSRRPGRVAGGKRGERTVQLLKISDSLYWSIVLWSRRRSTPAQPVPILDIYDEALLWFLEHECHRAYHAYLAVPLRDAGKRCLWVDSHLLERAGACAIRDGVPRNRVLYTALVLYLKKFGPVANKKDIAYLRKIKSLGGVRGRPIGS